MALEVRLGGAREFSGVTWYEELVRSGQPAGLAMQRGAEFSACGTWRYVLWRVWDTESPLLNVVGLNPSTADAERDDPTVRRCIGFARSWGMGGVVVTNLFAFRTPKPRLLRQAADPIGPANDTYINREAARAGVVLAAWGVHGPLKGRAAAVLERIGGMQLYCLGVTRLGYPRHPLYARGDLQPVAYGGPVVHSATER